MAVISPKADAGWIPKFREKYEPWFREAKALIETHQYPAAFKTYPFLSFDHTPWTPVRVPPEEARLGLVSTAGIFREGIDAPFADTTEGDPKVIELPGDVDLKTLGTSHPHIPQEPIRADVNVAFPLEHLRAMVREKKVRSLAPRLFSLVGYRIRADEVALETATRIAATMVKDKVNLALIVPV